jgi:hypothetical protein
VRLSGFAMLSRPMVESLAKPKNGQPDLAAWPRHAAAHLTAAANCARPKRFTAKSLTPSPAI